MTKTSPPAPGADDAEELIAMAMAAASDAGAAPAQALDLAVTMVEQVAPGSALTLLAEDARRLRLSPNLQGAAGAGLRVAPGLAELLRLVLESERNGDDLAYKLDLHLRATADRRETELKKAIETVPVYMIVVLVLFFMPAILMVLIGPSFLSLLRALYEV